MTQSSPTATEPAAEEKVGLKEAWAFFAEAMQKIVTGLVVMLLYALPALIWLAAGVYWGWSVYRATETTTAIFAPGGEAVPRIAWITVVGIINLPAFAETLWQARQKKGRKERLLKFPGMLLGLGLLNHMGVIALQALWEQAPLFTLSLPHLVLGMGLLLIAFPAMQPAPPQKGETHGEP